MYPDVSERYGDGAKDRNTGVGFPKRVYSWEKPPAHGLQPGIENPGKRPGAVPYCGTV